MRGGLFYILLACVFSEPLFATVSTSTVADIRTQYRSLRLMAEGTFESKLRYHRKFNGTIISSRSPYLLNYLLQMVYRDRIYDLPRHPSDAFYFFKQEFLAQILFHQPSDPLLSRHLQLVFAKAAKNSGKLDLSPDERKRLALADAEVLRQVAIANRTQVKDIWQGLSEESKATLAEFGLDALDTQSVCLWYDFVEVGEGGFNSIYEMPIDVGLDRPEITRLAEKILTKTQLDDLVHELLADLKNSEDYKDPTFGFSFFSDTSLKTALAYLISHPLSSPEQFQTKLSDATFGTGGQINLRNNQAIHVYQRAAAFLRMRAQPNYTSYALERNFVDRPIPIPNIRSYEEQEAIEEVFEKIPSLRERLQDVFKNELENSSSLPGFNFRADLIRHLIDLTVETFEQGRIDKDKFTAVLLELPKGKESAAQLFYEALVDHGIEDPRTASHLHQLLSRKQGMKKGEEISLNDRQYHLKLHAAILAGIAAGKTTDEEIMSWLVSGNLHLSLAEREYARYHQAGMGVADLGEVSGFWKSWAFSSGKEKAGDQTRDEFLRSLYLRKPRTPLESLIHDTNHSKGQVIKKLEESITFASIADTNKAKSQIKSKIITFAIHEMPLNAKAIFEFCRSQKIEISESQAVELFDEIVSHVFAMTPQFAKISSPLVKELEHKMKAGDPTLTASLLAAAPHFLRSNYFKLMSEPQNDSQFLDHIFSELILAQADAPTDLGREVARIIELAAEVETYPAYEKEMTTLMKKLTTAPEVAKPAAPQVKPTAPTDFVDSESKAKPVITGPVSGLGLSSDLDRLAARISKGQGVALSEANFIAQIALRHRPPSADILRNLVDRDDPGFDEKNRLKTPHWKQIHGICVSIVKGMEQ